MTRLHIQEALKHLLTLILTLLVSLSCIYNSASASSIPMPSITIRMRDEQSNETVKGGSLAIYKVGAVKIGKRDVEFRSNPEFANLADLSTMSFQEIFSARFAKKLAAYAAGKKLPATMVDISENGEVTFLAEDDSVYLITQEQSGAGYKKINPYCVMLPYYQDGSWHRQLVSYPKNLKKNSQRVPTGPITPSSRSKKPKGNTQIKQPVTKGLLPQTGQLNWPIPVLTIIGLLLFLWGWYTQEKEFK